MSKKMTKTEAVKICNWCGLILQLSGWDVAFFFEDEVPESFGDIGSDCTGFTLYRRLLRRAEIWVSSRNSNEYDEILDTICHEMLHVFMADRDIEMTEDSPENLHSSVYCLAKILIKAYKAGVK